MIRFHPDGTLVSLHDYCKINNIPVLKDEDCYCHLEGDTSSIVKWFFHEFDCNILKNELAHSNVWKHYHFSKEESKKIISRNTTLSEINEILEISHCFIMLIEKNSWVPWHYDNPRKGPVINLILTPDAVSHSLFTRDFNDTSNLIECKYIPYKFCLYNTDIIHSVLNFDCPRYLFSVILEEGKKDITWEETKYILRDFVHDN